MLGTYSFFLNRVVRSQLLLPYLAASLLLRQAGTCSVIAIAVVVAVAIAVAVVVVYTVIVSKILSILLIY